MPYRYKDSHKDIRFRSWKNFKEEIGNQISCEDLLHKLQEDPEFLYWIYEEYPDFNYDNVGKYLFKSLSTTEWLDVFADKSPKTWEEIMEEMLGEELYLEVKKVKEKAEEEKRKAEEEKRKAEEERKAVIGAIVNAVAETLRAKVERPKIFVPGFRRVQHLKVNNYEVGFPFRWCPSGSFIMGEGNLHHKVTFTKGFWMLETPVTQEMFKLVMKNNPSYFSDNPWNPVENVSWYKANRFCMELAQLLNKDVRLPTESQWEYACVAGMNSSYFRISANNIWSNENSPKGTHHVAIKDPNAWGLYDMLGNVSEWCSDYYGSSGFSSPVDPEGPKGGSERVARGGSYIFMLNSCTPTIRLHYNPNYHAHYLGFRVIICAADGEV